MAGRAGAGAHKRGVKRWRPEFACFSCAWRSGDAPARPCRARFFERTEQQTARTIALGEQQQTPRRLEIERLAASQGAYDHGARGGKPLLGRPQRLLALFRPHDNQLGKIEPVLGQPRRIGRTLFRERGFLPSPDQACGACPLGGEGEGKALRRYFSARRSGREFMQGRPRHRHGKTVESLLRSERLGGWTKRHVLYMF